jgi:hypothetical protein
MDTGAILVGIAVLVGVAAYVIRPLFKQPTRHGQGQVTNGNSRASFSARRDAIYALIRELDADHQIGKINDQDYQALRERYVAEGVSVLRQLDALPGRDGRTGLETEIEARVLALRRASSATQTTRQEPAAGFCTQCGQRSDPEDRFCARCGAPVKGTS